jgi:TonB family protein
VPSQQTASEKEKCCTLQGTVTSASGTVIATATIRITNRATKHTVNLHTDENGRYISRDLPSGNYDVQVEASGFKTLLVQNTEVNDRKPRLDMRLDIGDWGGCCEYAAAPMRAPDDYAHKFKPFTYTVGEGNDGGTLKGIAKLVYGDAKKWVQIFEANRGVMSSPKALSIGMVLTIPLDQRIGPELATQVLPAYPAEAAGQHVHGEVSLDLTLNEDGTVQQVTVLEGDSLLTGAAIEAVKRWRYVPLSINGKPVNKVVAMLTFEKNGKVH